MDEQSSGKPIMDIDQNAKANSFTQRLFDARWIIVALGILLLIVAFEWPEGQTLLVVGFFAIVVLIAYGPGRKRPVLSSRNAVQSTPRTMWPDTQVKLFVDALPEPGLVLDGEGILRHSNLAFKDVFGQVSLGDPLTFKLRDPAIGDAIERVKRNGQVVLVDHTAKFPTERNFKVHMAPVKLPGKANLDDGPGRARTDFIFVIMFDHTTRVRVDQLRSDFIANVSHELRTPVASMTGFIETLQGPAKDDHASHERFLAIMLEQANRMSRLVDDLLSLSRIEMRTHMTPREQVDLRDAVGHVVDAMEPIAAEADLTIEYDKQTLPMIVAGDKDELIQVAQNLIENACKYGADGKRVKVSLSQVDEPLELPGISNTWYRFSVRDFGQGIAEEHIPRLTERFYRIDAEESKRKMGTGLGLAVVKHVLNRHRARLTIESELGKGAEFIVLFPGVN